MIDPKTRKIRTSGGTNENMTLDKNSLVKPVGLGTAGAIDGLINAVINI